MELKMSELFIHWTVHTPCEAVYPASMHETSTTYACSAQLRKLRDKSMNPFVFFPPTNSSGSALALRFYGSILASMSAPLSNNDWRMLSQPFAAARWNAVWPLKSLHSRSAPAASKHATARSSPLVAATCNAV